MRQECMLMLWKCTTWLYRDIAKDECRPRCEMEEDLAIPLVRRATGHAQIQGSSEACLVDALRGQVAGALVATDGSCVEKRSAGWEIALSRQDLIVGYSTQGMVGCADQSSCTPETEEATQLLNAAREAGRRGLILMIDNLSVCHGHGVAAVAAKYFELPKRGFGR